jgi:hypothetical protein
MNYFSRLKESEAERQKCIDYLQSYPGCIGPEIIEALGWPAGSGASRLSAMVEEKELRRENTICYRINKLGFQQQQRTYRYWAIVERTKPAEEAIKKVGQNLTKEFRAGGNPSPKNGVWTKKGFINNDPNRESIRSQGGQGRASPRCSSSIDGIFL